jgi:hypothetical protein
MHGFAQISTFMSNNVMGLLFTTCIALYCRAQQWSCLSWFKETLDLARSIADCDFDMWLAVCKHQFMTLSSFRYEIWFLCAPYCLQRFSTWLRIGLALFVRLTHIFIIQEHHQASTDYRSIIWTDRKQSISLIIIVSSATLFCETT